MQIVWLSTMSGFFFSRLPADYKLIVYYDTNRADKIGCLLALFASPIYHIKFYSIIMWSSINRHFFSGLAQNLHSNIIKTASDLVVLDTNSHMYRFFFSINSTKFVRKIVTRSNKWKVVKMEKATKFPELSAELIIWIIAHCLSSRYVDSCVLCMLILYRS